MVDENIPLLTMRALRDEGHNVLDIRGTADEGMPDIMLWHTAQQQRRLLITTDKGFAQRRGEPHHGLLIVRLKQPNRDEIHQRVMQAMARFSESEWPGLLVIMRDTARSVWRVNDN